VRGDAATLDKTYRLIYTTQNKLIIWLGGAVQIQVDDKDFLRKAALLDYYNLRKTERSAPRKEDANWAALMKHSFGLDVLGCPRAGCKGRLALVAVIFDGAEVKRLLGHLRLFTEPIPVQSARDPPDLWTEAYDFD
jgi:hypothetical protein